jgi:energy-coupling factor transport system permease protein
MFDYYEVDSWLHRRNPTAKLAAHLTLALLMTIVFDPLTPLAFLAMALILGATAGRIPPGLLVTSLLPFWLIGVSLVISNALFVNDAARATVLWTWGPFNASVEGAMIGLSLAERSVGVAAFTVVLVLTTDPTHLVRSLVQQAHMPARFAYPALAAYRFLPLLRSEYATIRLAQRLRGQGRRAGPAGWIEEQKRLVIPLLAGAIRKADRVAVAMDSRGFNNQGVERTHYRHVEFNAADAWLLIGTLMIGIGILLASAAMGVLRVWTGALGA